MTYNQTYEPNVFNDEIQVVLRVSLPIIVINGTYLLLIFGTLGTVTNLINMVIFVKMGFRDTMNISLFGLAVADMGLSAASVVMALTLTPYFYEKIMSFGTTNALGLIISSPHMICSRITVIMTAYISLERCLCIAMPLKVKSMITRKRVEYIVSCIYILCVSSSVPTWYIRRLTWEINPLTNKSWLTVVFDEGGLKLRPVFYSITNVLLGSGLVVIVFSTSVLIRYLSISEKWRKSVSTNTGIDTKEKRIAKMVFIISVVFLVCYLPHLALIMYPVIDPSSSIAGTKSFFISMAYTSFVYVMGVVNSSINILVYYRNSSNYKTMLRKLFHLDKRN